MRVYRALRIRDEDFFSNDFLLRDINIVCLLV